MAESELEKAAASGDVALCCQLLLKAPGSAPPASAMLQAAAQGQAAVLQLLFHQGLKPANAVEGGVNALQAAAKHRQWPAVNTLLACGAQAPEEQLQAWRAQAKADEATISDVPVERHGIYTLGQQVLYNSPAPNAEIVQIIQFREIPPEARKKGPGRPAEVDKWEVCFRPTNAPKAAPGRWCKATELSLLNANNFQHMLSVQAQAKAQAEARPPPPPAAAATDAVLAAVAASFPTEPAAADVVAETTPAPMPLPKIIPPTRPAASKKRRGRPKKGEQATGTPTPPPAAPAAAAAASTTDAPTNPATTTTTTSTATTSGRPRRTKKPRMMDDEFVTAAPPTTAAQEEQVEAEAEEDEEEEEEAAEDDDASAEYVAGSEEPSEEEEEEEKSVARSKGRSKSKGRSAPTRATSRSKAPSKGGDGDEDTAARRSKRAGSGRRKEAEEEDGPAAKKRPLRKKRDETDSEQGTETGKEGGESKKKADKKKKAKVEQEEKVEEPEESEEGDKQGSDSDAMDDEEPEEEEEDDDEEPSATRKRRLKRQSKDNRLSTVIEDVEPGTEYPDSPGSAQRLARARPLLFVDPENNRPPQLQLQNVSILLPESLQANLRDQEDNIVRKHMLITVPHAPSAADILQEFVNEEAAALGEGSREAKALTANVQGLMALFTLALPSRLLYRFERPQYAEVFHSLTDNTHIATLYGAEFLIRLFVVLPELIVSCQLPQVEIDNMVAHAGRVIAYVDANAERLFRAVYSPASEDYLRRVEGFIGRRKASGAGK